jgi:hypothetical protein
MILIFGQILVLLFVLIGGAGLCTYFELGRDNMPAAYICLTITLLIMLFIINNFYIPDTLLP